MHSSSKSRLIVGSIINLTKESEEHYIALRNYPFSEGSDCILSSNISDYTLFLHNGMLFSHLVYNGTDFEADMNAMGTDKSTPEWCKLFLSMQQPLKYKKDNEWWSGISLWYSNQLPIRAGEKVLRYAYTFPAPADLQQTVPGDYFGDIDFWGTTYGLKTLRIFNGVHVVCIYLETLKDSDHLFLLEIIARVLKTVAEPVTMDEVFHTERTNSDQD